MFTDQHLSALDSAGFEHPKRSRRRAGEFQGRADSRHPTRICGGDHMRCFSTSWRKCHCESSDWSLPLDHVRLSVGILPLYRVNRIAHYPAFVAARGMIMPKNDSIGS